jgi:small nuclear ribonucleoprotein (snRNP)-like protein
MDTILLLSIFLVFASALVGAFVQRRKRDRVLTDLDEFHVTARLKDGTLVWGRAIIYPNGIELVYSRPYQSQGGHINTSFIMFKDAVENILALYRYHTELSADNQVRRRKEVRRATRPGLLLRSARHLRNFINTFRDAINESMGMLLTRMKGAGASMLFTTQEERLKKLGTSALGAVGNAYDAILERYIGRRVVVELQSQGGTREEYCGVLKEYSPAWIALLDCRMDEERKLPLADAARLRMQRDMDFWITLEHSADADNGVSMSLRIENHTDEPLYLSHLETDEYRYPLDVSLASDEAHTWTLTNLPAACLAEVDMERLPVKACLTGPERQSGPVADDTTDIDLHALPDLELVFHSVREVDVYIPRSLGTVRHGNEFFDA